MYCRFCGNKLNDNSKFCSICGKPVENSEYSIDNNINLEEVQKYRAFMEIQNTKKETSDTIDNTISPLNIIMGEIDDNNRIEKSDTEPTKISDISSNRFDISQLLKSSIYKKDCTNVDKEFEDIENNNDIKLSEPLTTVQHINTYENVKQDSNNIDKQRVLKNNDSEIHINKPAVKEISVEKHSVEEKIDNSDSDIDTSTSKNEEKVENLKNEEKPQIVSTKTRKLPNLFKNYRGKIDFSKIKEKEGVILDVSIVILFISVIALFIKTFMV